MKRTATWRRDLNAYIDTMRRTPYQLGKFDCCVFVAGCVKSMTGVDIYSQFAGKYTDNASAAALMRANGGLDAMLIEALGVPATGGPLNARYGDVVEISPLAGELQTLGIFLSNAVVSVSGHGLVFLPINKILKSWKVG